MPNGNCESRSQEEIAIDYIHQAEIDRKNYHELIMEYHKLKKENEELKTLLGAKYLKEKGFIK